MAKSKSVPVGAVYIVSSDVVPDTVNLALVTPPPRGRDPHGCRRRTGRSRRSRPRGCRRER